MQTPPGAFFEDWTGNKHNLAGQAQLASRLREGVPAKVSTGRCEPPYLLQLQVLSCSSGFMCAMAGTIGVDLHVTDLD